ncbi:MAG: flippase [Candidatus Margulisiibacteriota bacterium]|jgi:O-antigen/teichoic acid export membrane protein
MSTTKRIAKNFSWLVIGEVISKGLEFFVTIYIARVLGAAAFGLYSFALAFLAYLLIVTDFGLSLFGVKEISQNRHLAPKITLNIILLRLFLSLVAYGCAFIIVLFVPSSIQLKLIFWLVFLLVFPRAIDPSWIFQGLEKMQYIALLKIAGAILSLSLTVLLVKSSADLIKLPIINFLSLLIVALVLIIFISKVIFELRLHHLSISIWKNYVSQALPLGVAAVLIQVYCNLDSIMLGFMRDVEAVGVYNAAYKLFFGVVFLLAFWQQVVFPESSRRIMADREKAKNFLLDYSRISFLFGFPICYLVAFLAPTLINIFFGVAYSGANLALTILVWNFLPLILSGLYGTLILVPLGKTKEILFAAGGGALINIILNLLLIPGFGVSGAAVATLLTEVSVTVIMLLRTFKYFKFEWWSVVIKPMIASFVAGIVSFILIYYLPFTVLGKQFLVCSVFVAIYFIQILVFGEMAFLRKFIIKILPDRIG